MGDYEDQVEAWRAARYKRLTAPEGWFSLIGKFPLEKGTSTVAIPREKGELALDVMFDGARARVRFAAGDERELSETRALELGSLRLELLRRGDAGYLRVKDVEARARTEFLGIPHYPVDPTWRIVARLVPHPDKRMIELDYEGGAAEAYASPGIAEFSASGRSLRLTVLLDTSRPRLFVLFKDATNRDTTYGAGRFMYAPLPENERVVLDFNQAFNPPCALTPWASCPLVPAENSLPIRVEAGEKTPA